MLARRFTIVCLLVTLFGMLLSSLVAQASRPARSWEVGNACVFGQNCAFPTRR